MTTTAELLLLAAIVLGADESVAFSLSVLRAGTVRQRRGDCLPLGVDIRIPTRMHGLFASDCRSSPCTH